MLRRLLFILCVTLLSVVASAQDDESELFSYEECPFDVPDGADIECGYLLTPERHANPDGSQLYLAVAIIYARSGNPEPDPIIYLEGGPGGSALTGIDGWTDAALGENRDIILLDQRGTGYSEPGLFCEWYDYDFDVEEVESVEYHAACAENLRADGIDVSAYNSAESASDVALLIEALGYEQANLYGISYGTRVALTVMRDYPELVRAVVLDSPFPPHVNGFEEQSPNGWAAIQSLFDACDADPDCADAFPDLEARLSDFLVGMADEPIVVEGEEGEIEYLADDVVNELFQLMYNHAAIPYLPAALDDLIEGDPEAFADLIAGGTPADFDEESDFEEEEADEGEEDVSDSDGVFYSVHCAEEVPFNSLETARRLSDPVPDMFEAALFADVEDIFAVCDVWMSEAAPAIETEPVVSDIPTLILAGQFDPITPPVSGEDTLKHLSRGTLAVIPGAGHSLIDAGDCPVGLGVAFIDNPTASLDMSCVGGLNVKFATTYWGD